MGVTEAIQERTVYHRMTDDGLNINSTEGYFHARWLVEAINTIKIVCSSKGLLFTSTKAEKGIVLVNHKPMKNHRKIAHSLFNLLINDFANDLVNVFPQYEVNPYLKTLIENTEYIKLSKIHNQLRPISHLDKQTIDDLNRLVDSLREDAQKSDFKNRIKYFNRAVNKNHQSLTLYINNLFEHHSKLLVIRIDLNYQLDDATKHSLGLKMTHAEVAKQRKAFFNGLPAYIKENTKKDVFVGYAWKLEYGPLNGWHFHTLIFLNGQKSCEDIKIAKLIGDHWKGVTEGTGRYYNCNAKKDIYQISDTLGIGLIDHRDTKLRKNLENIVSEYLTKIDFYVKLILPNGLRSFGRGVTPKSKNNVKGRPRQVVPNGSSNGLSLSLRH